MATEREACGLGALLPVSCRGRAESFARRLHTRLRSLGGSGGGSTDLLRGADDEDEDGLDSGELESGGWGKGLVGNGGDSDDGDDDEGGFVTHVGNGKASGGGRGAEGGSTKYRSTDRGVSGGVTVQQPLPNSGSSVLGGPSPSPPTGNSPPYSSPRPRLDSGLESLGSPTSGTPPRPGSNGSESGVAGISSPANGYFSPPNDQGFSSGRWHASPSPEGERQHSRSPHQRPPRRKKDIRWPPSAQQPQESVEGGEAALPNFLECFPQAGVESPPETSWSPSSVSPENGAGGGSGIRYAGTVGVGEEHDGRCANEAYWQHYSYSRHHHARSPATPPLQSPGALPMPFKGRISPTSYTPPGSPITPEEAFNAYTHGNYSPTAALKSPISEASDEEDATSMVVKPEYFLPREGNNNVLNDCADLPSIESNGLPPSSLEEGVGVGVGLRNGHSAEDLPEFEEQKDISDICDTSSGDQPDTCTAVSFLSFDTSRMNLCSAMDAEEIRSEDEAAPLQKDRSSCVEKAEKVVEDEEVFSEDSMEREIQSLADAIYSNLEETESEEGAVGEEESEEGAVEEVRPEEGAVEKSEEGAVGVVEPAKKSEVEAGESHVIPAGVGECSPEEGVIDETELRNKYLDADSSDMDLKAVRIICEEMASRAMILEGDLIIMGISAEEEEEKQLCAGIAAAKALEAKKEMERHLKEELRVEEEDDEEREERTPRVRRSTSLKTGKTPPGTPSRKKIVRFADVLGLDLADVRTFLDEIPHVPKSAFQDLAPEASLEPSATSAMPHWTAPADWELGMSPSTSVSRRPRRYHLTPIFPQPGAAADFVDRIRERCVCLESAMEEDVDDEEDDGTEYYGINGWSVLGTVKVRNLAFYKTVHARASADGWRSHADVPASYLPGSCDGFSDRFVFELRPGIPPTGGGIAGAPFPRRIPNGGRLEFAVRFQCQGSQYWDNNLGANYVFSVEPLVKPLETTEAKRETNPRPPATPAPVRNQAAFRYLSLPSPDADWATFL